MPDKKPKAKRDPIQKLAAAISAGLKKDDWGDIDPEIFANIAKNKDIGEDEKGMYDILKKALEKSE